LMNEALFYLNERLAPSIWHFIKMMRIDQVQLLKIIMIYKNIIYPINFCYNLTA